MVRTDGKAARQLTYGASYNGSPSWSADGRRIFFESTRDGNREIYVVETGGTNATNLSKHSGTDHNPEASPIEARVAFMTRRETGNAEIYLMNADGSDLFNVTRDAARDSSPTWSPNGEWIAFTRTTANGPMDVFTLKSNGTQVSRLTRGVDGFHNSAPAWGMIP